MNNKELGTKFENEVVKYLSDIGYWVHFISPDKRGAQPFDIIAVGNEHAYAIDCKTCKDKYFRMDRLEDNQVMAFEKWLKCGNSNPRIAVCHNNKMIFIDYVELKEKGKINLEEL